MAAGMQQQGSTGHQRAFDQRVLVPAVSLSGHHVPLAFQFDAGVPGRPHSTDAHPHR